MKKNNIIIKEKNMFETPILYIIFNRLDTVKQTFPVIKKQQPKQLFIAADGPRLDRIGESEKCKEVREWVLSQIDWDCELKTLFREENLGCGLALSTGITWFFDNVEQGIILEDDCFPSDSFFKYCEDLLHYYRDDKRIMHISGFNIMSKNTKVLPFSYSFSAIQACWGWASWKDRWQRYSYSIDFNQKLLLENPYFRNKKRLNYWKYIFTNVTSFNTWDYQWTYTILINKGFCIIPSLNLITNIGFGSDSTHFQNCDTSLYRESYEIEKLIYNDSLKYDWNLISYTDKVVFNIHRTKFTDIIKLIIFSFPKFILKKIGLFNYVKSKYNSIKKINK